MVRTSLLIAAALLVGTVTAGPPASWAKGKKKKKLSLAELAALEWKLEQSTKVLRSKLDPEERFKALTSLATIDDPRVIKPLAIALREDPSAKVRRMAVAASPSSPQPPSTPSTTGWPASKSCIRPRKASGRWMGDCVAGSAKT